MSDNRGPRDSSQPPGTASEHPPYGFRVARLGEVNERFRCIFCYLLINNPIQLTECGHRACVECFESRARQSPSADVTCPVTDCQLTTNKSEIMFDKAFRRELEALRVGCIYQEDGECPWVGLLKDYPKHLDDMHVHLNCSACGEAFSSKAALDEHTKRCPNIYDQCRFGTCCSDEMILKGEFLSHLQSEKHQDTINRFLLGEISISEPASATEPDEEMNKELEEQVSTRLNELSVQIRESQNKTIEHNQTFEKLSQATSVVTEELRSVSLQKTEKNPLKQFSQTNQNQLQRDLEQLEELCTNSQYIPTDGSLTWKIDNVAEKMADAQSERQTSIYSPIFYSSPTGYKMRARLFLFGDGNARRTHISLFFLLMKGEYDSILKWPFHYKVIFCLLDQTGSNRHIIDSFYPDVKSNSFQRPREAQNTASGIPKFFPLPMLLQDDNSYVRENTMYLKIMIALQEIPKTVLPFMLTLNQALPSYVQENLINQEIAKQQANASSAS